MSFDFEPIPEFPGLSAEKLQAVVGDDDAIVLYILTIRPDGVHTEQFHLLNVVGAYTDNEVDLTIDSLKRLGVFHETEDTSDLNTVIRAMIRVMASICIHCSEEESISANEHHAAFLRNINPEIRILLARVDYTEDVTVPMITNVCAMRINKHRVM